MKPEDMQREIVEAGTRERERQRKEMAQASEATRHLEDQQAAEFHQWLDHSFPLEWQKSLGLQVFREPEHLGETVISASFTYEGERWVLRLTEMPNAWQTVGNLSWMLTAPDNVESLALGTALFETIKGQLALRDQRRANPPKEQGPGL